MYLDVAVSAPLYQTFTYQWTDGSFSTMPEMENALLGRRVMVPFGPRKITAYVVGVKTELSDAEQKYTLRKISAVLDDTPLFDKALIPFFHWIASYYHHPLGLVIKTALPGGLTSESRKQLFFTGNNNDIRKTDVAAEPWFAELVQKGSLGIIKTKQVLRDPAARRVIKRLQKKSLVQCRNVIAGDRVAGKKEECVSPVHVILKTGDFEDNSDDEGVRLYRSNYSRTFQLSLKLSEARVLYLTEKLGMENGSPKVPLKTIRTHYKGASKPAAELIGRGLLQKSERRVYRTPFGSELKKYPRPEQLSPQQTEVLDKIEPAIDAHRFAPFLLHGVTGAGKTEVYLRAAERAIGIGYDVIILVPEIALATQLEGHLVSRFGELVVLFHSSMTGAEKFDQYCLARDGHAKIVVGARSAVFAPLKNPGLIIVDEEHDTSYKQDDGLRYNGRDLAVVRAKYHDCPVILGSATPAVTSYQHAVQGKYSLLCMTERVRGAALPDVQLVDLSREPKENKVFSRVLLTKLKATCAAGKQAILLLNRRGFSNAMLCGDCGSPVQCEHCNVSLTLHKEKQQLICHYCGFTVTRNLVCSECHSTDLHPAGYGTERIEEELQELLPEAAVCRLDSDTAADRKKFHKVLAAMHAGDIDILIGTQMIAKGHHFPDVTLVGVVWADGGMSMPDYKAAEKTFQLITQVTGRAGRGESPGEVIIQTLRPEHYAIRFAQKHDYAGFFEQELALRRNPVFPPFTRILLLRIQGRVEKQVQKTAMMVARFCKKTAGEGNLQLVILGPAPSPMDKLRDKFRYQIMVKSPAVGELRLLGSLLIRMEKELVSSCCELAIDVDPENFM